LKKGEVDQEYLRSYRRWKTTSIFTNTEGLNNLNAFSKKRVEGKDIRLSKYKGVRRGDKAIGGLILVKKPRMR